MIETVDLTKRYEDGVLALNRLNLKIESGEIYCLLGANGAGKTTAIHLLLNFIEPTKGKARICGVDVTREPLKAKRNVSFVSENVMLYPGFSARQNLDYFARLAGKRDLKKQNYYDILRRVGLEEYAYERKLKTFSKGMRQKVGIAIAIVKDSPVVLLDEPTSGLDPKAADEFVRLLYELRDEGKCILMSTHDIFRSKGLANRIGILKEGRLVVTRTAEELEQEDLEALYLDYMKA